MTKVSLFVIAALVTVGARAAPVWNHQAWNNLNQMIQNMQQNMGIGGWPNFQDHSDVENRFGGALHRKCVIVL
uniref:Uncharacterized protein n=1 Tax=Romanomermis culicivorax TaxID=13658 RepID=A0A915KSU8_ROMCU